MTEPQSSPPVRYNSAVLGFLSFVVFNIALIALSGRSAGSPTVRSFLFLGNLGIPFATLLTGRARFAAGWAIGIGVFVVAFLGICFYALGQL